ncbi:PREDICTED: helicase SKI2W [Nicrophorus vespilloides]|uniref:Helicase SKI2W n=1 Tax=Nicrophorus vespilloides TaxID=110193 RepID=A0ABM1ML40_NICVS|nr:PREDICTED: helicase SKI2W [Nicrophorus vespilloides]
MEPPPILPDIEHLLRNYLICPDKLPIHKYERSQEFWPRTSNYESLLHYDGSPLATTLKVQRDPNTGEITEFKEVPIQGAGATAKNSMSLTRAPGLPSETVRGCASYIPFMPAGFHEAEVDLPTESELLDKNLLTVPPGFNRGITFKEDGFTVENDKDKIAVKDVVIGANNKLNLFDLLNNEDNFSDVWNVVQTPKADQEVSVNSEELPEEADVIPKEVPLLVISKEVEHTSMKGTEFAILLDSTKPIPDFNERIPEMAHQYPFELDTFQKQAILQLEQHNHVFVAAHTSAGKTVVAEYAIALSKKHMTRSIYTSPIKALSNQKYRDFKQIFKDVGLITGDFQINQTASCLIMTTEILRSMLYCGSDVTRDLEYVIFDEVHYINDKERGHVWEQVLILLPAHVCVVLLSATVPNTTEFADWLGRTHQRKVYVVTTYQRPVPLEHYLYTGTGGSTKDNRYSILSNKGWNEGGYMQAKASIPNVSKYHPKQEKTMWFSLVDHLKKKELLPVVVFTFSRAKCDNNAENLKSLDLTTEKEKSAIHRFFEKCVKSLKEPDRNIPQIRRMREILERGIGVHHSGILPIIKEMVEMLFQNGLIKLLFATETFAMGVNMPARTVIFDSISKHDGRERRNLLPAEYIQMAGRAGRRGKDKKGTVIILCKGLLPYAMELQDMMLGKPSQLTSQFRLTYGMVLSLLRVESLSVEGMMSRSFREADHQKKMNGLRAKLVEVENNLNRNFSGELSSYLEPLIVFYERAKKYLDARKESLEDVMKSKKVVKELIPGRVVLITYQHHINKLALILSNTIRSNSITLKVLVIIDESENQKKSELWYQMLALSRDNLYAPIGGVSSHEVLSLQPINIFKIYDRKLKIDGDMVLKDWDKRQIPRFSDNPPGPSCNTAIQELMKVQDEAKSGGNLKALDLITDLKINEHNLYENTKFINNLRQLVLDQMSLIRIPNFEDQFTIVYEKKVLEDERDHLKYMLSHASMTLYPDYENRIKLLRDLKYVDLQNRVELKGRVACEMGMNELIVTELVLRNILTKLQPAEVAALLSSIVFQAKTMIDINEIVLTDELTNGIFEIKHIYDEIQALELKYEICEEMNRELNFGLVEVVYEWASAKPFAEIMNLTDVQEGIIVRCIQQLNETICDVKNAARLIGDPELQNKMEEASTAIKRDIVFAASLYTQKESTVL